MAARLFTKAEFYAELERAGLQKSPCHSERLEAWLAPNNLAIVLNARPDGFLYAEWMLDDILIRLNLLYRPWDQPPTSSS